MSISIAAFPYPSPSLSAFLVPPSSIRRCDPPSCCLFPSLRSSIRPLPCPPSWFRLPLSVAVFRLPGAYVRRCVPLSVPSPVRLPGSAFLYPSLRSAFLVSMSVAAFLYPSLVSAFLVSISVAAFLYPSPPLSAFPVPPFSILVPRSWCLCPSLRSSMCRLLYPPSWFCLSLSWFRVPPSWCQFPNRKKNEQVHHRRHLTPSF